MSVQPATAVVLVAAGRGERLGAGIPKALAALAGRTLLEHALEGVLNLETPVQVIVVAPPEHVAAVEVLVARTAGLALPWCTVVAGGASRQLSVAAGLAALGAAVEVVLVHDAARSLTPTSQIAAVAAAVRERGGGVVPGLAVTDTIKVTDDRGVVTETLNRDMLRAMQTPQGFPRDALVAAYAGADTEYTDDAALFAAAGNAVTVIDGDPLAAKITTGWDLRRAEAQFSGLAPATRSGIGIDVHGVDASVPLRLALLDWPGEAGLAGHSDGDAVAHAVCDALLSAAGLGDLGAVFGTDDPRYAGSGGEVFLAETVRLLAKAGWAPDHVAVQLVARRPRFAPRRREAEAALNSAIGAPVSVAATTSDGLGFTGRGEGIAVIATAVVRRGLAVPR